MKLYLSLITILTMFFLAKENFADDTRNLDRKQNLGKLVFEELACFRCHDINNHCGASPKRKPYSYKYNAPTIFNVTQNRIYFWDGNVKNVRDAIKQHFIRKDLGYDTTPESIVNNLKRNKKVSIRFKLIYGKLNYDNILDSLVSYLKSLNFKTRFDRYIEGDDKALTDEEIEGYNLFKILGCINCHNGKNLGGNIRQPSLKYGRMDKSKLVRVPSLRFVVCTSPYFHDGSEKSLKEAIRTIAKAQLGIELKDGDLRKLLKFLNTLGDRSILK